MIVHVGNSFTIDDVLNYEMLFETKGVGPIGKFKEVEVDADNESEEERDTSGSDSKDLDYDPKHDEVFDDDEHILKDVPVIEVQEHDLDVIDYDSFGSDLDDGIDSERKNQLSPWPGQILTSVGVDANNGIYPVAYAIVKAESKRYCVRHIHKNMKSQFKGGVYKNMLWNAARATTVVEFNKQIGHLYQVTGPYRDQCVVNMDRRVCSCRKWELTGISCKHVVAAIYNMSENEMGINPCNGREMWPVVESTTIIISPNHKPQVGRPPKKKKKSLDEIASQRCSLGKLSRKGRSVKCSKCRNLGHNRKGCRGQGGASQAGGSSQASARQGVSARNVFSQVVGSRNASSQADGSSQPSATLSTSTGAKNASSQAASSSQPSASPSTASQGPSQHSVGPTQACQGPSQGFQAPRPALSSGPQRLNKKIASRHNLRKLPS
ncbi:mutator type transposase [Tanacetum coccineum]